MLTHYRAMVALSRQMLEAARLASWEQLVELGRQRDQLQAQVQAEQEAQQDRRPAQRDTAEETELVSVLLAANAQIQRLVEDHLAALPQAGDGARPGQPQGQLPIIRAGRRAP